MIHSVDVYQNSKGKQSRNLSRTLSLQWDSRNIGALEKDTPKNIKVLGLHEKPAAIELNNQVFVPLIDFQGNICHLVDPTTKAITSYTFTAFGEEINHLTDENPWRYAAKRFDPELNLIYFGKRYYDPALARWLTTDPAGFADSLNLYQYAFNNPNSYYDPNGELAFLAVIPFALFFTPAAIKICVDAVTIGIGCWGLYKSSQYAAEALGSPYKYRENGTGGTKEPIAKLLSLVKSRFWRQFSLHLLAYPIRVCSRRFSSSQQAGSENCHQNHRFYKGQEFCNCL